MNSFLGKARFLVALMTGLFTVVYSQSSSPHHDSITALKRYDGKKKKETQIKWTSQLPPSVKRAFNESPYKNLFVENISRRECSGKVFYKFYLNNGNLLDGDHYDSFLKRIAFEISDSGVIVRDELP